MVQIVQVFNNNSALVDIGDHRQAIVSGKGIAFNRHKGSSIVSDKVDKIFYLDTKESQKTLYFLLKDIPIDIVTTTYEIIDYGVKKYNYNVLDYAYITLSDHILGSYQRILKGNYVENLIPDMHDQYPVEYAIANHALLVIENNLRVVFPKSEIRGIALHFINAKGNESQTVTLKKNESEDINEIVNKILNRNQIFRVDANSNYYDRFMIHLQYLAGRLDEPEDKKELNPNLEVEMRNSYPDSFEIANDIYEAIQEKLGKDLSSNELIYFIIHIQRLIQEDVKS
ncbi:PRD domain-containing protein [Lactobacillus halodurans]|uniref:PRD domain-containing protein n=1 Tax=Companilactobacillus halodurans TaxID=2584183 RepID=A0A5P0ZKY2_9LACO|nr:PRD domain-containing protein [Companilactobacillus halodurans]MQS74873.1 PRD domain-containing protein [Companilactobacillus halodurans]